MSITTFPKWEPPSRKLGYHASADGGKFALKG